MFHILNKWYHTTGIHFYDEFDRGMLNVESSKKDTTYRTLTTCQSKFKRFSKKLSGYIEKSLQMPWVSSENHKVSETVCWMWLGPSLFYLFILQDSYKRGGTCRNSNPFWRKIGRHANTTTKGKFSFFQMPVHAFWHHRYLWALLLCLIPSLFRIKLRFLLLFDVHHGQVETSFIIVNLHKAKNAFSGMPHLRMSYVEIIQAQLI